VLILCLVGGIGWSFVSRMKAEYTTTYDPYAATRGSISNSLSFTGTMQLVDSATYTASSDAKVREVYVAAGDRVQENDRLVRLSNGDLIRAEFDGTVSTLSVSKDDEVKAGASLVTVADFDHMTVQVRVGESDIASVHTGQACRVTVSSAGASYDSTIDSIDYVAYTGNNVAYYTTTVRVDTSATENIYPGMQATVTIPLEEAKDVIILKMDAISTAQDNTAFVYKEASDGTMTETPVTVGVSNGNYVEIKDGISEGETVYAVAKQEETATGLAGLFSSLFSQQRVNRPTNGSGGGMQGPGGGDWQERNTTRQNTNSQGGGGGSTRPGGN